MRNRWCRCAQPPATILNPCRDSWDTCIEDFEHPRVYLGERRPLNPVVSWQRSEAVSCNEKEIASPCSQ